MTIVHCRNSNGLVLRLYEMVEGPLGIKQSRPTGAPVELRPGRNEVDDAFMTSWLSANEKSDLLTANVLHVEKPEPEPTQAPPEPPAAGE